MAQYFIAKTNKPSLSYKVGEKITFSVFPMRNMEGCDQCERVKCTFLADDGTSDERFISLNHERFFTTDYTLTKPGFVKVIIEDVNEDDTPAQLFETTSFVAGAEVESIAYRGNFPPDFDEYWGKIMQSISDFGPKLAYKVKYDHPDVPEDIDCFDVRITTPQEGNYASGYLCIPKNKDNLGIIISFQGYAIGGAVPRWDRDAICFVVNAHGIENGFAESVTKEKYKNSLTNYGFDEKQNQQPETTYWQGMMLRDLCALFYAKTLPQWDKKTVVCQGGSQAALQATTVAAHDKDVSFLNINVPWFCDLHAEETGVFKGWRVAAAPGLEYFDTVAQASRVTCPVNILAYLGDHICVPSPIMALYNTFDCKKSLDFVQSGDHGGLRPNEHHIFRYRSEKVEKGTYVRFSGERVEVLDFALDKKQAVAIAETGPIESLAYFDFEDQPCLNVIYRELDGERRVCTMPAYQWFDTFIYKGKVVTRYTKE